MPLFTTIHQKREAAALHNLARRILLAKAIYNRKSRMQL